MKAESGSWAGLEWTASLHSPSGRTLRELDREAVAAFLVAFGPQLRRRIRGKLSARVRRLYDSQEILSTVGRRLDRYVLLGRLSICTEEQLRSLVSRIAIAAIADKARATARIGRVERPDGELVADDERRRGRAPMQSEMSSGGELDRAVRALRDPIDREILVLWLRGTPHNVTASVLGMAPTAVRKRWQSIRQRLREHLFNSGQGAANGANY